MCVQARASKFGRLVASLQTCGNVARVCAEQRALRCSLVPGPAAFCAHGTLRPRAPRALSSAGRPGSAPRHPPNVHLAKVVDVGRVVDQPRHLPVDRVRRGRAHLINALQLEVDLIWQSGRGADVKGAERDPPISAQGLPKRSLGGPSPPPSPPRQTLASPPGPPASCASTTLRVGRGVGSRGS